MDEGARCWPPRVHMRHAGVEAARTAVLATLGLTLWSACSAGRGGSSTGNTDVRASCSTADVTRDAYVTSARHTDGESSSVVRQFWDGRGAQRILINGAVHGVATNGDSIYVLKDDGIYVLNGDQSDQIVRAQVSAFAMRGATVFYVDENTTDLRERRGDVDRLILRKAPGDPGALLVTDAFVYWRERNLRMPDRVDARRDAIWRVPIAGGAAESVASVPGTIGAYCVRGKGVVFVDRGVPRDRLPELDDTRLVVVDPDGTQRAYPLPSEDVGGLVVSDGFAYLTVEQRIMRVDISTGRIEDVAAAPGAAAVIAVDAAQVFVVDEHDRLTRIPWSSGSMDANLGVR